MEYQRNGSRELEGTVLLCALNESHNHPRDPADSSIALYMTFAIAAIMILIQVLDVPLRV